MLVAIAAGMTLLAALTVGVAVGRRWPVSQAVAPPPVAAPRAPETALIDVEVDPPDSVVTFDGKPVDAPLVHVVRGTTPIVIVAEAPDHLPAEREVVPDRDQRLLIHLTSTAAPREQVPPPRRPPAVRRPAGAAMPQPESDLKDPFGGP
jgi:hypothetical protein